MDPNPTSQPILSYVLSRLPPSISFKLSKSSPGTEFDLENPKPVSPSTAVNNEFDLADTMPGLKDPALLAALSKAVSDVDQTRSVLRTLGPRPDHEVIDKAKARAAEIDADLSQQLEVIVLSPRPDDVDHQQWGAEQAEKEMETREAAEKEKIGLRALLQLDEMHDAYEGLLTEAEQRLNEIYRSAMENPVTDGKTNDKDENQTEQDEINDEVTGILEKGKILDRVDLSDRQLKHLPDAFAKLNGLVSLNLSNNQLENVPDIIGALESLEELCISNNILTQLPDSIGLMTNLKILNVSGNKLKAIPDSIAKCRSLVELDASYNQLAYLPTNIGVELINLQILRVHLNKLRSLPSSICKMVSLRLLDAHFNELHGLPSSIGELSNLETLNLSSNFSDLQELPVSFGELLNLKDVDLSNNQIRVLPASFGRLEKLEKLNLDQNPLEDPPIEIVSLGIEAVKNYMSQKWLDLLVEIEEMDNKESGEGAGEVPVQMTWLTRTVSSVKGVAGSVAEYLSPRANKGPNRESYLDQEF